MKSHFMLAIPVIAASMILGACATKKYVAQQVDPVQTKVNQIDTQLQATDKQVATQGDAINSTSEIAKDAQNKANNAQSSANNAQSAADAASRKADAVRAELEKQIGSLDDYKVSTEVTINFATNSAKLTREDQAELDKFAAATTSMKRYIVALVGHTDQAGSATYNFALSRRRAEAVQTYLIAKGNVPVFRIQIVGLGKEQPVDDSKTRAGRARNRRVDVTLYAADSGMASGQPAQ
jgi:OOP family OmpA-OmpF porin